MQNLFLLYLKDLFVMHKLFLLYLMEYIRESRRPPGRLKGEVWGGGAPTGKTVKKYIQPKLRNI